MKFDITDNNEIKIPDYQYEMLARCIFPKMQSYFESEEGKKDLEEYRAKKTEQTIAKTK